MTIGTDWKPYDELKLATAAMTVARNHPDVALAMLDNDYSACEMIGKRIISARMAKSAEHRHQQQILADRARILAADNMEPADYQETHSPTEATEVRIRVDGTRRVTREVARRRKPDARLWSSMRPEQEAAAENVAAAWYLITGEVGCKVAKLQPGGGGRRDSLTERATQLVEAYMAWARDLDERSLNKVAAIAVLLGNETMRDAERSRRKRNGWARDNLMDCLDRYANLFPRLVGRTQSTSCAPGTK
jgi:hypothetical protein